MKNILMMLIVTVTTGAQAMDTIGPVFQRSQGISTSMEYRPQYSGPEDGGVLVSPARRTPTDLVEQPKVITKIVYRDKPVDEPIKVTAELCDENSCADMTSNVTVK